uniref:Putative glycoside hydrolase n=1 Tax=viral metagenome TaxID=1070528 RepID=A0A6M3KJX6_9ZZZZ
MQINRRNFIKTLGLVGGTLIIPRLTFANIVNGMSFPGGLQSNVTVFDRYASNPVIDAGSPGTWNAHSVRSSDVLYYNGLYYQYYYGHIDNPNSYPRRIGMSTSSDGYNYTSYAGNPILDLGSEGEWDDCHVTFPTVLKKGSTWYMYYGGDNEITNGSNGTGLATSTDGYTFTKISNGIEGTSKILQKGGDGTWDEAHAAPSSIIWRADQGENGEFWLYYSGVDISRVYYKIGLAKSTDGINFTKYNGNPIFSPSATWESSLIVCFGVFEYNSVYYAVYSANTGANHKIGIAKSIDGITWTRTGMYFFTKGNSSAWDDYFVLAPRLIFPQNDINQRALMYYTAVEYATGKNRIGVAIQQHIGNFGI